MVKTYTLDDVREHTTEKDCWLVRMRADGDSFLALLFRLPRCILLAHSAFLLRSSMAKFTT